MIDRERQQARRRLRRAVTELNMAMREVSSFRIGYRLNIAPQFGRSPPFRFSVTFRGKRT